jgi:lipopolysaccharide/colanic/teichoic acid biosynthesis glycosyltransferase
VRTVSPVTMPGAVPPPRRGLPRAVDAAVAGLGLLISLPLLAVAAAAVALSSPGPIVFRQSRIGRGGRPFRLLKLRTMRAADGPAVTGGDDPRITAVGRFLRRSKLDEIPGLWNVVRGDMALVGPRPEVARFVDPGDPLWAEVLTVRPGMTDPAVVAFRHEEELLSRLGGDREVTYNQRVLPIKLGLSRDYLRGRTWHSDLAVLWRTALCLFVRPPRLPKNLTDPGVGGENPPSFPTGPSS